MAELKNLPLKELHTELGAKFVPFAGYEMPVQYSAGVMAEHLWCRKNAGLFDVSHMGQVRLQAGAGPALEALAPVMAIEVGQVEAYRLLVSAIASGDPEVARAAADRVLRPATDAILGALSELGDAATTSTAASPTDHPSTED